MLATLGEALYQVAGNILLPFVFIAIAFGIQEGISRLRRRNKD